MSLGQGIESTRSLSNARTVPLTVIWLSGGLILYLATGFFTVPANEKAIVRRFGKAVTPLLSSGLHFDFPWPLSRIDRVNMNEVRILSIGDLETDANFLQSTSATKPLILLTGDKNLILLRLSVQYRFSEESVVEWLYSSKSPMARLQLLVETTAADLVSRCGVDFVHTRGLTELNHRLLHEVRRHAKDLKIGCEVEQVTIDRAEPPARVKAEFLDVSNARADNARSIHEARSYSEKRLAESEAEARQIIDTAEQQRRAKASAAQGSADRFTRLYEQIQKDAKESGRTYVASRQLVMNRITFETFREIFKVAKLKILSDDQRSFDLTFPP